MPVPQPVLGVSFSHRHAQWLGLDPRTTLEALLSEVGVRHLRLSLYWDEIAPVSDRHDYAPLRPWLELAARYDARVLMTVGLKAQRHPEFYPPSWLTHRHTIPPGAHLEEQERLVAHLLLMLERSTAFLADYDVVTAWQVENEPFVPSARRTVGWQISPELLAREIAVVRDADPRHRPIVVNHASRSFLDQTWRLALKPADVLAQNIYTRRPLTGRGPVRYWNDYAWWFLSPNLRAQARAAGRTGRQFWITELQAEPWENVDVRGLDTGRIGSVSPGRIRRNLALIGRTAPERVYLWGAEWWRFMAEERNDDRYWRLAMRLFQGAAH